MGTYQTTLFQAREKPLATRTSTGTYQLQLLAMEPLETGLREAWRLHWTGPQAQAWYEAHRADLQPGQPLAVHVTRLRALAGPRGPEIHARVLSLELAPRRHPATAPAPERSAA